MIPFRLAFSETQVDRHCAKSEIVHGHVCEGRPWLELWSKCFWIQGGFDGAIFRSWTRDYVVYTWNSVDVRMLVWTISIWRVLDVPFASDSAFLFDQYLLSCKHMCWYSHAVSWRSHRPSLLVLDRLWGGLCLIRYPVITAETTELEKQYENLLKKMEFENSLLSDHELQLIQDEWVVVGYCLTVGLLP